VPFLLWLAVGGVLQCLYTKEVLFASINGHYSSLMNQLMYYTTELGTAQVIIPVLLLPMLFRQYRTSWYFALASACNVAPFLVLQLLKSTFASPRPMYYYEHTTWVHIMPDWDRLFERSYPSGHSEGAFSLFCFLSLLLPGKYRFVGVLFFVLAAAVAYSRVYLTAHFFEDVYTGSIIGVVMTMVAYILMNKYVRPRLAPDAG